MSLTTSVVHALATPLTRSLVAASVRWHPRAVFSGGVKGFALDLTDRSTLYQDSARTTLVSAAGDPIGSPSDISGNGAHPVQATAASRPLWQTAFAAFDGVDDGWATPAIDFGGTTKVTIILAMRKASDVAASCVTELGTDSASVNGTFGIFAPHSAGTATYRSRSRGTLTTDAISAASFPAPNTAVLSAQVAIDTDTNILRVNGALSGSSVGDQGAGSFANLPVYIGRRAGTSLPLSGNLHRMIVVGKALNAAELAAAERWCAIAAGVTLP